MKPQEIVTATLTIEMADQWIGSGMCVNESSVLMVLIGKIKSKCCLKNFFLCVNFFLIYLKFTCFYVFFCFHFGKL